MKRDKAVKAALCISVFCLFVSLVAVVVQAGEGTTDHIDKSEVSCSSLENVQDDEEPDSSIDATEEKGSAFREDEMTETEDHLNDKSEDDTEQDEEKETSGVEAENTETGVGIDESTVNETENNAEGVDEETGDSTENANEETEDSTENATADSDHLERKKGSDGLVSLQVPLKMNVTLNPWELDGQAQIYSHLYEICNQGDTAGTLRLYDLVCGGNDDIIIQDSAEEIHNGNEKKVYLELIVNEKDIVVLTRRSTEYTVQLKPKEEITLQFHGELNEKALREWESSDLDIMVKYQWEDEETAENMLEDEMTETEHEGSIVEETETSEEGGAETETVEETETSKEGGAETLEEGEIPEQSRMEDGTVEETETSEQIETENQSDAVKQEKIETEDKNEQ